MKGIDVSKHQGIIDWKMVADSGIDFAIIRAGYGKSNVDERFIENIVGAHTGGLKVGVYWFIYALNEEDALKNAEMFHQTIEPYKEAITFKVFADYEYDSDNYSKKHGVVQNKSTRTKIVKTFLNYLKSKGWDVGNYANPDYIKSKFNDLSEYPLWLAWYTDDEGRIEDYNPCMWQYTSNGSVSGIKGYDESKITYYPIPEFTLTDYLEKVGANSTYNHRCKIAKANGISDYKGTSEQNLKLLKLLKEGKLIKP